MPLVALQPDQPRAERVGHGLAELGLAGARGALDEHRLDEPVREEDDARDLGVGEVAVRGERRADLVGRAEPRLAGVVEPERVLHLVTVVTSSDLPFAADAPSAPT